MNPRKLISQFCLIAAIALAAYAVGGGKGCDLPDWTVVVDPTPVVKPPFVATEPCVLIIEETAQRGSYTSGQLAAILSRAPGSVWDKITVGGNQGGVWRVIDKDQNDFGNAAPWVKEAFAVPHPELPWIVAAGPKTGVSQKLPDTVAETLKLLEGVK